MEFLPGGERFVATNVPLGVLILTAYNLTPPQFSSATPAQSIVRERFDVQLKADHPMRSDEMRRLLRALLQDRFKLIVRQETRQVEAYALMLDKGGQSSTRATCTMIGSLIRSTPIVPGEPKKGEVI